MLASCSRMTLVKACRTPGRSWVRTTSASGAASPSGAPFTGPPPRNERSLFYYACPDSRAALVSSLRAGRPLPPKDHPLRLPTAVGAHLGPRTAHVHGAPATRAVLGPVVERPQAPLVAASLEPLPGPLGRSTYRRDEQAGGHPPHG